MKQNFWPSHSRVLENNINTAYSVVLSYLYHIARVEKGDIFPLVLWTKEPEQYPYTVRPEWSQNEDKSGARNKFGSGTLYFYIK